MNQKQISILIISFFTAIMIGILVLINLDPVGHKLTFEENNIKINTLKISKKEVQTINLLDDIKVVKKINGAGTTKYRRGKFKLENGQIATLYVYKKSKPYIQIITNDKIIIYNDKTKEATKNTYKELIANCKIDKDKPVKIPDTAKTKLDKNDIILDLVMGIPLLLIFTGIGVFSIKKKTPMHFWSGSTVKSEEIDDIKAYNKANGIMWISYGLILYTSSIFIESIGAAAYVFITIFGLLGLVICYYRIYNKYKAKKDN